MNLLLLLCSPSIMSTLHLIIPINDSNPKLPDTFNEGAIPKSYPNSIKYDKKVWNLTISSDWDFMLDLIFSLSTSLNIIIPPSLQSLSTQVLFLSNATASNCVSDSNTPLAMFDFDLGLSFVGYNISVV